ncbi:EboA domain-containing protein [Streptomyces albidochromogenes]|uniref:EboA domain-containing protein n=1 Tax=Streptomyces albidochromogenes TaxID=329524 RepID=UPI00110F6F27|nr:EboA domain-containing protein [Streptomyces albidochromogenes]
MLTALTELTDGSPARAVQAALEEHLAGADRAWLHEALAEAQAAADAETAAEAGAAGRSLWTLPTWELRFAEAGRHCRPARGGPSGPSAQDLADAARVLLLHTVRAGHDTTSRLYTHGSAAERRAVLLALPHLSAHTPPASALALVEDALRTNDTRLVAAAVGPYAAEHLDQHAWRHAVLKCLFTGVPVDAVDGLAPRARGDAELARMLRDYAAERTAAGRPVPDDLHRVLALTADRDTADRPHVTAAPSEES